MRATIDFPDEIYRELKIKAAKEGKPLRQIVLRSVQRELTEQTPVRKFEIPIIPSSRPGTLELTNEQIYDLIGFP
jgi:hypothetical protein